jgi:hypothetical protein
MSTRYVSRRTYCILSFHIVLETLNESSTLVEKASVQGFRSFWRGGKWAASTYYTDGAIYNPASNSWTKINSTGAPSPCMLASVIWTGREMIVWGGDYSGYIERGDGAHYDPYTDTWTPTAASNALSPRYWHEVVWTGSEMTLWGGKEADSTGADYNFGDGKKYRCIPCFPFRLST